jgi:hypothetical protein
MISSIHDVPNMEFPVDLASDNIECYNLLGKREQGSYYLNVDVERPRGLNSRQIKMNPHDTRNIGHESKEELAPSNSVFFMIDTANDQEKPSLSKKGRTKSFDRRLCEAAQYAEAVGDLPSNYDRLIVVDDEEEDEEDGELLIRPAINHFHEPQSISTENHLTPLIDERRVDQRRRIPRNDNSFFQHQLMESAIENPLFHASECFKVDDESACPQRVPLDPPEITTHGISRGNFAQLHRKAWLEVSDKYHRYGKNLRVYYKFWEELGHPTNVFFDWLDSKGEAAGQALPNLTDCPRSELDADTVLYITNPEIQRQYKLSIVPTEDGENILASGVIKARIRNYENHLVITGPEGWIFVLRDHELYAAKKVTSIQGKSKQRFHHSSFFGGKAVQAAGILITDDRGFLKYLYPHSGHYRPGEAHMQSLLYHFYKCGVDIKSFEVDLQQIMHVSREKCDETTPKGGDVGESSNDPVESEIRTKIRKTESLYLETGFYVAAFLGHKSLMISLGVFDQIQRIHHSKSPMV